MNSYQQQKWRAILSAAQGQVSPAASAFFHQTLPAPKKPFFIKSLAQKLKSAVSK